MSFRLAPDVPFPPYSFVPGRSPHPVSDPEGHSFGITPPSPSAVNPERWAENQTYLYGLDLFNAGYFWESHVEFEALWLSCGRHGVVADFLKGLIKLAAAGVKHRAGVPDGVQSHARRAADLWRKVARLLEPGQVFLGFRFQTIIEVAEEICRSGWPTTPPQLMPTIATTPWKPTPAQVAAAAGKTIPDVLAPNLRGVFVGINPGLYTAAIGCHFGRPGNRFWPALHAAGFTDRLLSPFEQQELLSFGWGITNLVARATAAASELTPAELIEGAAILEEKIRQVRPRVVAVLGVTAYRTAFHRPDAKLGLQTETLADVPTWVLPNPSGLNAHYRMEGLARLYAEMRGAVLAMSWEDGV